MSPDATAETSGLAAVEFAAIFAPLHARGGTGAEMRALGPVESLAQRPPRTLVAARKEGAPRLTDSPTVVGMRHIPPRQVWKSRTRLVDVSYANGLLTVSRMR
jgi:hypothetical protein